METVWVNQLLLIWNEEFEIIHRSNFCITWIREAKGSDKSPLPLNLLWLEQVQSKARWLMRQNEVVEPGGDRVDYITSDGRQGWAFEMLLHVQPVLQKS